MAKRQVYMDHNATTPLHPEVKKVMTKALEDFGNPSSLHSFGRHARKLVEDARATVASFIGASPDEIIFMGSGSEANNTVLSMFSCPSGQCLYRQKAKTEIITSNIEH
ncbi:MAG: aminotransferase class V-fold PLP-dependent enzyme, partial [Candidatus Omnitrophica bacterium]|nr:aminotransferase class V-fold PLP-dependent enzyme [Candidatus Omnitrophota bacterium]